MILSMTTKSAGLGAIVFVALLAVYFGVLTLVSGWAFALGQFAQFWYYVLPLGAGFGLQVAFYFQLRELIQHGGGSGTMMAASGTTSTAAMISCCTHYLVNIAPILGATGLVTLATQYQVEFFWLGLLFNAAGIVYIGNKLINAAREHAKCATI